ncbi:unnamed protein product [Oikopleura dioica]|uniref:Neurotransmitter-gated ion-channel transmembrane domain-containing protein n=1 Tax=Oikopleura dioica TaxID=34765 RepID=E4XIA3_OIKDI|nr:unnamed protein product [Oikopleura dioica]
MLVACHEPSNVAKKKLKESLRQREVEKAQERAQRNAQRMGIPYSTTEFEEKLDGGRNMLLNTNSRVAGFAAARNTFNVQFPVIKDVSIIDRVSRVVFPFTFIIFNIIYWTYYIFF